MRLHKSGQSCISPNMMSLPRVAHWAATIVGGQPKVNRLRRRRK
jgi:hypothetical protein